MRRIVIAIGATLSGLVLLFSWPTSTNRPVATEAAAASTGGSASGAATTAGDATASGDGTASGTTTYDGDAVSTRYGDVQVRIGVTDGVITSAEAIAYPSGDPHDDRINGFAIPVLQDATVTAQSADIDMVSGATVTSRAYVESLQSALDQAGL